MLLGTEAYIWERMLAGAPIPVVPVSMAAQADEPEGTDIDAPLTVTA